MKYNEFKKKIGARIFTRQEMRLRGIRVFAYQLSLWQKQGYIVKLKNGVYAFCDRLQELTSEEVSPQLYCPSYISLEKALSVYGLIPEMVYAFTSVTPKATRYFKNSLGDFIFRHVKAGLYFGYLPKKGRERDYLLAEPEKALLDLVYLNNISTKEDLEELRINWRLAKGLLSANKIREYLPAYHSKVVNRVGKLLMEKVKKHA